MEIYLACMLFACALGLLIYKASQFTMFMLNTMPGEELKWKRAPSLPIIKTRDLRYKGALSVFSKINQKADATLDNVNETESRQNNPIQFFATQPEIQLEIQGDESAHLANSSTMTLQNNGTDV